MKKKPNPAGINGGLRHLMKRDKNLCHVCGLKVKPEDASRSHLVARSRGGKSSGDNLALAHKACNQKLGAAIVEDVRATARGWRKREAPKGLTTRPPS